MISVFFQISFSLIVFVINFLILYSLSLKTKWIIVSFFGNIYTPPYLNLSNFHSMHCNIFPTSLPSGILLIFTLSTSQVTPIQASFSSSPITWWFMLSLTCSHTLSLWQHTFRSTHLHKKSMTVCCLVSSNPYLTYISLIILIPYLYCY